MQDKWAFILDLFQVKCLQIIHFNSSIVHVMGYTVHGSVQTEPNPQVLGLVLCEGGPDPYLQVQGPGVSGPDLRVEPGPDLSGPARIW